MEALRRVMDLAPAPVFVLNEDGYYVYENEAAEALLGYDQADVTQKHLTDVRAADPDWVRSGFARLILRGYKRGRVVYRRKDGGLLKADVNAFMHTLSDGSRVDVALVHPIPLQAPDLVLAAAPKIDFGLAAEQMRLLQLLSEGFSNLEMADLLHVAPLTMSQQVDELLRKLGVSSQTEAAIKALKTGAVV